MMSDPCALAHQVVVTAQQMRSIEAELFGAGLPVAALMEKVVQKITQRITQLYPLTQASHVGVLVGSGHNGGDALGVARELHHRGYRVTCVAPVKAFKDLTAQHRDYIQALGIPWYGLEGDEPHFLDQLAQFPPQDFWVDGLFGFGLERPVTGLLAQVVDWLNDRGENIVSIDLPSGLHSDRGQPLGTAIHATQTLCLGLWKQGFSQDSSLAYTGHRERIDFDIPSPWIQKILGTHPPVQWLTPQLVQSLLPLPIAPTRHKYQRGHVLLVVGSRRYRGAAVLAGLGARASGVGLCSLAVPEGLADQVSQTLPEALVIPCPETPDGTIAQLPELEWTKFQSVAWGSGLTLPAALSLWDTLALVPCPLVVDADGLNALGHLGLEGWRHRPQNGLTTILTPHFGEFRRLFPALAPADSEPPTSLELAQAAAQTSGAIVLLKGAQSVIAQDDRLWITQHSTPALGRGGSGDVLTGLMAGLLAIDQADTSLTPSNFRSPQPKPPIAHPLAAVLTAVGWHAQAGLWLASQRTALGVDAYHLAESLNTIPEFLLS